MLHLVLAENQVDKGLNKGPAQSFSGLFLNYEKPVPFCPSFPSAFLVGLSGILFFPNGFPRGHFRPAKVHLPQLESVSGPGTAPFFLPFFAKHPKPE